MAVNFFNENIRFSLKEKKKLREWILSVFTKEEKEAGDINYVFCKDEYLNEVNQKYLSHDTYTDIITFSYSAEGDSYLLGDIFISIDRVKENALKFDVSFEEELRRVMVHGVLHLAGYKDKKKNEKETMRKKENDYLKHFNKFTGKPIRSKK